LFWLDWGRLDLLRLGKFQLIYARKSIYLMNEMKDEIDMDSGFPFPQKFFAGTFPFRVCLKLN